MSINHVRCYQQIKAPAAKPEFDPWDLLVIRRKRTPSVCPLTSTWKRTIVPLVTQNSIDEAVLKPSSLEIIGFIEIETKVGPVAFGSRID